jgi:pimeloyl-ACP methyl ester carboxylesterase
VVVFLHGLFETEFSWRLGAGEDGETYGSRLARDLGCTPVDVRYNTGRHISENGRSLSELLEAVVAEWPVEVEEVALVGHSMGGLVARSACHGRRDGGGALGQAGEARRLAGLAALRRAAGGDRPCRGGRPGASCPRRGR